MFNENEMYNKLIKRQMPEYLKNKRHIQNKVNMLLSKCNCQFVIGTASEVERKIDRLGGVDNLIYIGGGGVIFKAKKKEFEKGMLIVNILKQRNLRLNFYGGLLYELGNYEYCIGLTTVREILQEMGIKYNISDDDIFKFDKCYQVDPNIFNYVVELYKHQHQEYF